MKRPFLLLTPQLVQCGGELTVNALLRHAEAVPDLAEGLLFRIHGPQNVLLTRRQLCQPRLEPGSVHRLLPRLLRLRVCDHVEKLATVFRSDGRFQRHARQPCLLPPFLQVAQDVAPDVVAGERAEGEASRWVEALCGDPQTEQARAVGFFSGFTGEEREALQAEAGLIVL